MSASAFANPRHRVRAVPRSTHWPQASADTDEEAEEDQGDVRMNDMAKNLLLWVVIAVVLITVFQTFNPRVASPSSVSYSDFMQQVENNAVADVTISATIPATIAGKRRDGSALQTVAPLEDSQMISTLRSHNVRVSQDPADNSGTLWRILLDWVPFLIFIGLLIYFMRQMQAGAGGRGAMSFGRSRARLQGEDQVKITFADVAGVDEAKDEVQELVEFLRDP